MAFSSKSWNQAPHFFPASGKMMRKQPSSALKNFWPQTRVCYEGENGLVQTEH